MGHEYPGKAGRSAISPQELDFIDRLMKSVVSNVPVNNRHHPRFGMIEIGTLDGVTASVLADRNQSFFITSIDPFKAGTATGPGNIENCLKNIVTNTALYVGNIYSFKESGLNEPKFNVIFIDGDHSYHATVLDLVAAEALLVTDGGILILNDYEHGPKFAGVDKAVHEFIDENNFEIFDREATTIAMRRKQ